MLTFRAFAIFLGVLFRIFSFQRTEDGMDDEITDAKEGKQLLRLRNNSIKSLIQPLRMVLSILILSCEPCLFIMEYISL